MTLIAANSSQPRRETGAPSCMRSTVPTPRSPDPDNSGWVSRGWGRDRRDRRCIHPLARIATPQGSRMPSNSCTSAPIAAIAGRIAASVARSINFAFATARFGQRLAREPTPIVQSRRRGIELDVVPRTRADVRAQRKPDVCLGEQTDLDRVEPRRGPRRHVRVASAFAQHVAEVEQARPRIARIVPLRSQSCEQWAAGLGERVAPRSRAAMPRARPACRPDRRYASTARLLRRGGPRRSWARR